MKIIHCGVLLNPAVRDDNFSIFWQRFKTAVLFVHSTQQQQCVTITAMLRRHPNIKASLFYSEWAKGAAVGVGFFPFILPKDSVHYCVTTRRILLMTFKSLLFEKGCPSRNLPSLVA